MRRTEVLDDPKHRLGIIEACPEPKIEHVQPEGERHGKLLCVRIPPFLVMLDEEPNEGVRIQCAQGRGCTGSAQETSAKTF